MEDNELRRVLTPTDFHEALEGVATAAFAGVKVIELNLANWRGEHEDLQRLLYIARRKDLTTIVKNYEQLMVMQVFSPRF